MSAAPTLNALGLLGHRPQSKTHVKDILAFSPPALSFAPHEQENARLRCCDFSHPIFILVTRHSISSAQKAELVSLHSLACRGPLVKSHFNPPSFRCKLSRTCAQTAVAPWLGLSVANSSDCFLVGRGKAYGVPLKCFEWRVGD